LAVDIIARGLAKLSQNKVPTAILQTWEQNKSYEQNQLIEYLGTLYRTKNNIDNSITSPDIDSANYEVFSGGNGNSTLKFPDFTPNYNYSYREIIWHNNILYSAKKTFISNDTFNSDDFDVIADMRRTVYDQNSNGVVDKAEYAQIADEALETHLMQTWKPNTDYTIGQNIVYDYKTYTVTNNFTSNNTFDGTNLRLSATGNHNELLSLQGGKKDEYYHIDNNQYNLINNLSENTNNLLYKNNIVGDMSINIYDKNKNGIVDKAEKLDGLISSIDELNYSHGLIDNIQSQFNKLSSIGNFTQSVPTYADLQLLSGKNKDMVIVISDENENNISTIYMNNGTSWEYAGAFTATIRDFNINPLNVTIESTGLYTEDRIDPLIARKSDINNFDNADLLKTYTNKNDDITKSINQSHTHNNKTLLDSYNQTNVDIASAIVLKHKHDNKDIIDGFSKDADGTLLYNGNVIGNGSGGSGIIDLSNFTTSDLTDSTNKRYVTDKEKSNLQNLTNIANAQSQMNQTLNNISSSMPSNVSSSNPLTTTNDVKNSIDNLQFKQLNDVDKSLLPDSFIVTNSDNTKITSLHKLDELGTIKEIIDKNNITNSDIESIQFNNFISTFDNNKVKLDINVSSTELNDMPKQLINDTIPVVSNNQYELQKIEDITNSHENYSTIITSDIWTNNMSQYYVIVNHDLHSKNLIVSFYDENDKNISLQYQIIDENDIQIFSNNNLYCKVIINCSQGTIGDGTGNGSGSNIVISDIINDNITSTNKTYSSQKLSSLLNNYMQLSQAYTKQQSNTLYASKISEHTHNNMNVLNQLTNDNDNNLYYNGQKIITKLTPSTYQQNFDNQVFDSLSTLININDIFVNNHINAILNSEILIQNNISATGDETIDNLDNNQLHLVVLDSTLKILDVNIPPSSVQKYILGISPNISIMLQGQFSSVFYLTSY